MKILLFSDYHGATDFLQKLPAIVEKETIDLIVFCGDIVKGYARGNEYLSASADSREPDGNIQEIVEEAGEDLQLYEQFYEALGSLEIPVYVIPGNMDAPKTRYMSAFEKAKKIYSNLVLIHKYHEKFNGFTFTGFGGEITEAESEDFFVSKYDKTEVIQGLCKAPRTIYVTHTPPLCHKVDLDSTVHKGNGVVNEVLERMKPLANFCGHAHGGRGSEKIGNTMIINPGAFKKGNFAFVNINEETKAINVLFNNCKLLYY